MGAFRRTAAKRYPEMRFKNFAFAFSEIAFCGNAVTLFQIFFKKT